MIRSSRSLSIWFRCEIDKGRCFVRAYGCETKQVQVEDCLAATTTVGRLQFARQMKVIRPLLLYPTIRYEYQIDSTLCLEDCSCCRTNLSL